MASSIKPKTLVANINSWSQMLEEIDLDRVKSDKITTVTNNLLVLSCALYRIRNSDPMKKYLSLTDTEVAKNVIAEDEILAQQVHSHFSHKLVLLTLRGKELTKFRKDLATLLNTDFCKGDANYQYPTPLLGIAYKLPYLYYYDKEISDIFGGDYCKPVEANFKGTKQLTYLRKVKTHRKNDNDFEYWFNDEYSNKVCVRVEERNPLLALFDNLIKDPVQVTGKFEVRFKDTLQYYAMPVWNIVV